MELKENIPTAKSIKRDEIVRQAFDLFYKDGFHATGVDSVVEGTGISKRTLYKYFGSKEGLIVAAIGYYHIWAYNAIYEYLNRNPKLSPKEKVLYLFDYLSELIDSGNLKGCFAMNAKSEYNGQSPEIEHCCNAYTTAIETLIYGYLKDANMTNSKKLAMQIMILFGGAIVHSKFKGNSTAAKQARYVAELLLDSSL
ncbi:MAG TPA: TetR/AcrR family transcriptional regulator [Arachidicoccus sp.]